MYEVKNVLISVIKNEIILFASEYTIMVFPNAIYHIVSVIPKYTKRSLYTKLYKPTLERIITEAMDEVELILYKHESITVKKRILYGDAVNEINKYISDNRIDLLTITSSATPTPPPGLVGSTASRLVASTSIPVLVVTPIAYENKDKLLEGIDTVTIACINTSLLDKAVNIAYNIARRHTRYIRLIVSSHADRDKAVYYRDKISSLGLNVSLDTIKHHTLSEFAEKTLKITGNKDLLIVARQKKTMQSIIPWRRKRLSIYERLFMGLSHVPILFV